MRLPKVLPGDVLTKLPLEPEWHSEEWTGDDTAQAHRHFFGKSLEEAERMFGENSMLHQEDVMWMPFIPSCYYLQAYSRYILSAQSTRDPDGANSYLNLIDWFGDDLGRMPAELRSLIDRTLTRLASDQKQFEADVEIYGSFPARAELIRRQQPLIDPERRPVESKLTRLAQLLEAISPSDDANPDLEAFDQLAKEACLEWLPEMREAFASAPDFVIREALAFPLVQFGGAAQLALLLEGSRKGTEEGHDNDSLNAAICDLVEEFPEQSFALLSTYAVSANVHERHEAAWLLGFVDTPASFAALTHLLQDKNVDVLKAAVPAILGLRAGDGRKALAALPDGFRLTHRSYLKQILDQQG